MQMVQIEVTFDGITICFKDVQLTKLELPIDVTLDGIAICDKEKQNLNAE